MIRLLVVDIDGVLSLGEAAPFDGTVLQRLAAVNDRARHDPTHLATTLCTGRPAPYVEVLTQVIHGFKWHHSLTPTVHMQLMQLHSLLYDAFVATGRAFFQPGKSASFSLF